MSWPVSRRSSSLALRFGRRAYAKICTKEVVTGFDTAWRGMSKEERDRTIKDYAVYESQDWHTLSLEQKRAIYTIAYGPPEFVDPYEGYKVFGGVMAVMAGGIGVFAFARYKSNPPPKTLSPEWQRAQDEYIRSQNGNPIFGISSEQVRDVEDLEIP